MIFVTADGPGRWTASNGAEAVGRLQALVRPDQRCGLYPRDVVDDRAFEQLVDAALRELDRDLYIEVDEAAATTRATLADRGFAVHRREHRYLLPTEQPLPAAPEGYGVVSAADADLTRLSALDDALRQDVPGADGWHNDPQEFAARTFGDPEFDPATYLVAVQESTGDYAGLVRVWQRPERPRLGMIAVLPPHRRRGLARWLIASAFAVCHERDRTEATCEVDVTNDASNTLMAGLRAKREGCNVELRRPFPTDSGSTA